MYSSIKKTKTRPGDWLAILGAGGGLGHMYELPGLCTRIIVSFADVRFQGHTDRCENGPEGPCN